MNNNVTPISRLGQSTNKASKLAKIFTPIVIGSALALGGKANATEVEKPLPEASQLAELQAEKPSSEVSKIVNFANTETDDESAESSSNWRFAGGYIAGAIIGHLFQRRRDKKEINELEQEIERLRKLQKS